MTHEQERYAGEIIRALELSGAKVPLDVQQMWDDYKNQAESVSTEPSDAKNMKYVELQFFKPTK